MTARESTIVPTGRCWNGLEDMGTPGKTIWHVNADKTGTFAKCSLAFQNTAHQSFAESHSDLNDGRRPNAPVTRY
jgi:predicted secreted protein